MPYEAVKENMMRMLREGATPAELDLYVASEGLKPADLKENKHTLERSAYQAVGGVVGGAVASPGAVTTPIGIGLGSAAGGQIYDLKEEVLGRKTPESLVERSIGAAEDFTLDVISPIALSKGIYGVKKVAGAVGSKAKGIFKPAEYSVYKKFGVEPTAGLATQSQALGRAEDALGRFPLSSDILQKQAQSNIEQLTVANRFLAKEYGPILSREEIGTLLKKASPDVLEHYSAVYEKLYSQVSREIGTQRVGVSNTFDMLKTLVRETKTGPSSGVMELAKEIANKAQYQDGDIMKRGLSWESLKKYRTKIGDMLKRPELISTRNIQSGDLKRLYASMSQDMEQAAAQAGEKVHARWRAANKYFETKLTRDIPIIEDIIKKQYPEEVFDIVMRSSQKGGSRLRLLKKQLSANQWNAVSGTVLGKLGVQTPGAATTATELFSPTTFMTNWTKLSPAAKNALYGSKRYAPLRKELDDFVKVAGDMKAVERLANQSNTGSVLMFFGLWQSGSGALGAGLGGAMGGVPGAVAGAASFAATSVALPRLTAKLLTNPKFVRWLNKGFQIAKTRPNDMSTHLGRLMVLRFNEDIQEDVDNYVKALIGE